MALKVAPQDGSYRFVMRKCADHDPEVEELVPGYDEAVTTRDITHPDGLRRRTAYISDGNLRERLLKTGWEDVTDRWTSQAPSRPRVLRVRG